MSASSKLRRMCNVIYAAQLSLVNIFMAVMAVFVAYRLGHGRHKDLYIDVRAAYIDLQIVCPGTPFGAPQTQSSASQAGRWPEPSSRTCSRALVPERGLLRRPRSGPGEVRDAASGSHRGDREVGSSRTLRRVAPNVLPGRSRLRASGIERLDPQASRAEGRTQAHAPSDALYRREDCRRRSSRRPSARSTDQDGTGCVGPPPQYRTRPGAEKKTVITAAGLPPAAVSVYETLRSEVLRGQARPDGLGAVVYHGMLDGLAQLMSVTTTTASRQPQPTRAPSVRGDRAFVTLLANMVLQAQSEVKHAY